MEEKGQEMDKLRQELKDKEVESRIAGKKGDQLVRICLFDCFAFRFCLCAFGILSLLHINFAIYKRRTGHYGMGRDGTGSGVTSVRPGGIYYTDICYLTTCVYISTAG